MKTRRSAISFLVALVLIVASCSGSDDVASTTSETPAPAAQGSSNQSDAGGAEEDTSSQATGQDDDMFEIPSEIRDVTAETLNVSKDSIEFNAPFALGDSGCFLQTAYSADSTAFGLSFGVLGDGQVVAPGPDAVATMLDACDAERALSADEWAELVVRLEETPLLVQVMTEALRFAAEDMGATWTPPAITAEGDSRTLHFFAYGTDFGDGYDVTVTRSADGTVASQFDLLRPGG